MFAKKYTLPNGQGHAFAYMPQGPKQRGLELEEETATAAFTQTPMALVRKQAPGYPTMVSLSLNFPTLLSAPSRDNPPIPQGDPPLLLPTLPGRLPGTLKDTSLEVRCEMWPAMGSGGGGGPPCLTCGAACGQTITKTVLVRSKEGSNTKGYYHPHCVCHDCNTPMQDMLRVPWTPPATASGQMSEEQFYHPDCTCQFCYKPFTKEGALQEETTHLILAAPEHKYKYKHLRFHKHCPKIKSPGFNVVTCASCNGVVENEETMVVIDVKDVKDVKDESAKTSKRNKTASTAVVSVAETLHFCPECITEEFVFKARVRESESNSYYDHAEHIETIFNIDFAKLMKRRYHQSGVV